MPLWNPSPVKLGAVGYLLKPAGSFISLFNSFAPHKAAEEAARRIPSLHGYGIKVDVGMQRQDKRNAAQRGIDKISGLLTFRNSERYVVRFWVSSILTIRIVDPLAGDTRFLFDLDTNRPICAPKRPSIGIWRASTCRSDGFPIMWIASSRSMVLTILSQEKTLSLVSRKIFHNIIIHAYC